MDQMDLNMDRENFGKSHQLMQRLGEDKSKFLHMYYRLEYEEFYDWLRIIIEGLYKSTTPTMEDHQQWMDFSEHSHMATTSFCACARDRSERTYPSYNPRVVRYFQEIRPSPSPWTRQCGRPLDEAMKLKQKETF